MTQACIIFDLDGTLVDSERLCSQGYLDLIPEITDPLETFYRRYRGGQMAAIARSIEERFGVKLPPDFETPYRERVAELLERHLQIVPGVEQMLDALKQPYCVASNGPQKKMRHSLGLTGLLPRFEGRLYSAYDIGHWKPDPRLFLHAAQQMGFAPDQCVVVEDSEPGVIAALAAGMRVLQYRPEAYYGDYGAQAMFTHMDELPGLLMRLQAPPP